MKHSSLFSGIGGFDLAAEWMGWENVFHCEWNEFGQKVLKYYWPKAISYADITKTDFSIHRGTIDILTGGFPCQPYSQAGKRKGKEDDRHLWPEMLRAIREIQPGYIVGENVRGLTNWNGGLVFDEVQADLEAQGYEVLPFLLPACGVNAPHRRDRIWFVAYSDVARKRWHEREKEIKEINVFTNPGSIEFQMRTQERDKPDSIANANSGIGREGGMHSSESEKTERHAGPLNTRNGRGGWQNFPTQPPVCNGNDGLSNRLDGITFSKWRNESIKGGGNAIVPQVAFEIFKAIEQHEAIV